MDRNIGNGRIKYTGSMARYGKVKGEEKQGRDDIISLSKIITNAIKIKINGKIGAVFQPIRFSGRHTL